jgi:hypothetical protein
MCATVTAKTKLNGNNVGDANDDGILNPGEIWEFECTRTFSSVGMFTHTATGHGTDPTGTDITYPLDEEERTTINVKVNACDTSLSLTVSPSTVKRKGSVFLKGVLLDCHGNPVSGKTIHFHVNVLSGPSLVIPDAKTSSMGTFLVKVIAPSSIGMYEITAHFHGNLQFGPALSNTVLLKVV